MKKTNCYIIWVTTYSLLETEINFRRVDGLTFIEQYCSAYKNRCFVIVTNCLTRPARFPRTSLSCIDCLVTIIVTFVRENYVIWLRESHGNILECKITHSCISIPVWDNIFLFIFNSWLLNRPMKIGNILLYCKKLRPAHGESVRDWWEVSYVTF